MFHRVVFKSEQMKYGVRPVYGAHAEYFELRDVYSIAREVIGYGAYLTRGDG